MPRDIAFNTERSKFSHLMLPVPVPSIVWARARQAFAIERIEQLPLRARLLDVLEHLNRGHLLALMGATLPAVWLDGYPDITLLAGVLFTYGYVQIAGRRKLREGRAWWNGLTLWQRLQVRVLG
jgi:hypothetical protein